MNIGKWYSEAAEFLGVSNRTVYRLVDRGMLKLRKHGFDLDELEDVKAQLAVERLERERARLQKQSTKRNPKPKKQDASRLAGDVNRLESRVASLERAAQQARKTNSNLSLSIAHLRLLARIPKRT